MQKLSISIYLKTKKFFFVHKATKLFLKKKKTTEKRKEREKLIR